MYDVASDAWLCFDLPDEVVLSEAEVDAYVANNGYLTVAELSAVALSGDYNDLINLPEDSDTLESLTCSDRQVAAYDGESASWMCLDLPMDRVLSEAEVDEYVLNNGYLTSDDVAAVALTGDYNDLVNRPEDSDTLAALDCADGQYTYYNASKPGWDCGSFFICTTGKIPVYDDTIGWTCQDPPGSELPSLCGDRQVRSLTRAPQDGCAVREPRMRAVRRGRLPASTTTWSARLVPWIGIAAPKDLRHRACPIRPVVQHIR